MTDEENLPPFDFESPISEVRASFIELYSIMEDAVGAGFTREEAFELAAEVHRSMFPIQLKNFGSDDDE